MSSVKEKWKFEEDVILLMFSELNVLVFKKIIQRIFEKVVGIAMTDDQKLSFKICIFLRCRSARSRNSIFWLTFFEFFNNVNNYYNVINIIFLTFSIKKSWKEQEEKISKILVNINHFDSIHKQSYEKFYYWFGNAQKTSL